MSQSERVLAGDLKKWLEDNVSPDATILVAGGVLRFTDGDQESSFPVPVSEKPPAVTAAFTGPRAKEGAEALFVQMIDGGLDQGIETHLNDHGFDAEIGDFDMESKTQFFTVK